MNRMLSFLALSMISLPVFASDYLIDHSEIHLSNYTTEKDLQLHVGVYCSKKKLSLEFDLINKKNTGTYYQVLLPKISNRGCGSKTYRYPITPGKPIELSKIPFLEKKDRDNYLISISVSRPDRYDRDLIEGQVTNAYFDGAELEKKMGLALYGIPNFTNNERFRHQTYQFYFENDRYLSVTTGYEPEAKKKQLMLVRTDRGSNPSVKLRIKGSQSNDPYVHYEKDFFYRDIDSEIRKVSQAGSPIDYNDDGRYGNGEVAEFDEIRAKRLGLKPCGLKGDVQERIRDCNVTVSGFSLVTRTKRFKEIFLDQSTGLFWSAIVSRLDWNISNYNFTHPEIQSVCESDQIEFGGLSGVKWRVPMYDDYALAAEHGIGELPTSQADVRLYSGKLYNPNKTKEEYWTSDKVDGFFRNGDYKKIATFKDGSLKLEEQHMDHYGLLRCVGSLK